MAFGRVFGSRFGGMSRFPRHSVRLTCRFVAEGIFQWILAKLDLLSSVNTSFILRGFAHVVSVIMGANSLCGLASSLGPRSRRETLTSSLSTPLQYAQDVPFSSSASIRTPVTSFIYLIAENSYSARLVFMSRAISTLLC